MNTICNTQRHPVSAAALSPKGLPHEIDFFANFAPNFFVKQRILFWLSIDFKTKPKGFLININS